MSTEEVSRTRSELDLQKVLSEIAALRKLADTAEALFNGVGISDKTPYQILSEALLCAQRDIELLEDASAGSCTGVEGMAFVVARNRIDLAIELAKYRQKFGRDGKVVAANG